MLSSTIKKSERLLEIDFLRGLAVLGMVLYHEVYIAVYLLSGQLWIPTPPARVFGWLVAFTFLLLFGVAAKLKTDRMLERGSSLSQIWSAFAKRGLLLAAAAAAVSLVSYLVLPEMWIRLGVLHFFALSCFLLPLLLVSKQRLLLGGLVVVILSYFLPIAFVLPVTTYWLLPLNITPPAYTALDHWPLIPYLLLPILGALFTPWYVANRPKFFVGWKPDNDLSRLILWVGQHSLFVYLLHAPVLVVLTWTIIRLMG